MLISVYIRVLVIVLILLTQQLNLIKTNKDKIIAESNRELETFKKFQIAAQANPNLTYKEFCENINNK